MGILRVNQVSGDETQLSTLGIGTTTPVTGSVYFDGSGDYLSLPNNNDFNFGVGEYTIEFWLRTGTDAGWLIFNAANDTGLRMCVGNNGTSGANPGTIEVNEQVSNVDYFIRSISRVDNNIWNHIAVVRQKGQGTKIYINGNSEATGATGRNFDNTNSFFIGTRSSLTAFYNGYISNLRIIKGTALYTANFTPPTTILEPIQDTVLLCCNNPDSAGAVSLAGIGTSKTITVNGNAVASTFNPGLVRNFTSGTQFTGVTKFDTQGYFVPPSGTTTQRGRGVGLFGGGYVPGTSQNTIQFINIQSQGNAQDFGDLSSNMGASDGKAPCAAASAIRALFASGYSGPGPVNTIEYITISTTSNSIDFGDLTTNRRDLGACSSSTRALFGGGTTTGSTSTTNVIEYVTIASLGNAVSFGTLTQERRGVGSCSSSTRGIWGGGYVSNSPATRTNRIDYVTIATTGNAVTFGDLTVVRGGTTSCSSSTRGLFAGGSIYVAPASTFYNTIDYITIASTGNAQDFGDLSSTRSILGSCSNSTRGVFGGGGNPTMINTMEFVLIASTGNATDFGDLLSAALYYNGGCSDSHGGIS